MHSLFSIFYRDIGTQSSQLLSLQPELANFPGRMLIHAILPAIGRLCQTSPNLWVYAMPLHAELAKLLPEDKYMFFAGPYLGEQFSYGCVVVCACLTYIEVWTAIIWLMLLLCMCGGGVLQN
jgi:hypothetical protein